MGYWGVVLNVIKNADLILLVADARLPDIASNEEIVSKAQKYQKEICTVFNKVDLISPKELSQLQMRFPDAFFTSVKDKSSVAILQSFLQKKADTHTHSSLRVGILGYPNTGKSSLLNLLSPHAHAKVSSVSGTTKKSLWVRSSNIRFVDSPGVIPMSKSESVAAMLSSKDPHKIKNPEKAAIALISYLQKNNPGTLKKSYGIEEKKPYETFLLISKKKGHLHKKGELDEERTARMILSDWQSAKISLTKTTVGTQRGT